MRHPQLFERWELIGLPGLPFEAENDRPIGQPEARSLILGQPEKPISGETGWMPVWGEHWRHGGWYVSNIQYANGGCGCVSNNYPDRKWRIACDSRPFEQQPTFKTRTDAAIAEHDLVTSENL